MMQTTQSQRLYAQAKQLIPGGVNSPVRAFGSVGMEPLFIRKANGAIIEDVDGNSYLDYVCSWGPMILGHAVPQVVEAVAQAAQNGLSFGAPNALEVEVAQTVVEMTGMEMVRMVNSGTEAVMSALRLARGVTGRNKVIKFEGCYHGHSDSMLVKAGSGALTSGQPSSAGVPVAAVADTLTAQYNDLASVEKIFAQYPGDVAALIVEPVAANMGVVLPQAGFLQGLRSLCDRYGALLIFDEVITGFRLAPGGAQAYFGVMADLVTYGKIIGGGLPVGAYGGRRDLMAQVAPSGKVYQAGTLSGNPVAMAAGLCQLKLLRAGAESIYPAIEKTTAYLAQEMRRIASNAGVAAQVNQIGSLCCVFFTEQPVTSYAGAVSADTLRFAAYFRGMLQRGIYLAPSQFEAMFISTALTPEMVEKTLVAFKDTLAELA
ncbi:glutamate-1-semialdehyde 2,1-aminomutase [Saezia sanguinis]|uniref:glutamate-1-semialdehyde 2,1-aminomutase n=1 Tax=Saezia sanguinis TaxID=1965230 RepID=UPI00306C6D29